MRDSFRLGGRSCECSGCGERFGGVEAFELHRTGKPAVAEGPERRRCMTGDEMRRAGLSAGSRGWGRPYGTPGTSRIGGKVGSAA